jgi:hypothetical protein
MEKFLLIDPLALILRPDIYVRLHLPDPAPIEVLERDLQAAVKQMSKEEIGQTLERVRGLASFAKTAEKVIGAQQSRAA